MEERKRFNKNIIYYTILALLVGVLVGRVWENFDDENKYMKIHDKYYEDVEAGLRFILPYEDENSGLKQLCFVVYEDNIKNIFNNISEEKDLCFMTAGQRAKMEQQWKEI